MKRGRNKGEPGREPSPTPTSPPLQRVLIGGGVAAALSSLLACQPSPGHNQPPVLPPQPPQAYYEPAPPADASVPVEVVQPPQAPQPPPQPPPQLPPQPPPQPPAGGPPPQVKTAPQPGPPPQIAPQPAPPPQIAPQPVAPPPIKKAPQPRRDPIPPQIDPRDEP